MIDQKDVGLMQARLNAKAAPKDPMDMNRDGKITQADVQLLKTQCTYPNCAVPTIKPTSSILTPPVVHSAPGPQGGAVSITWNAVSGALDYLVYRITCSPSESTPPPAAARLVADACNRPDAPSICSMLPQGAPSTPALYGYPSAPELLGRVTSPSYGETAPNTLQSLYFVVAEDSLGNLSSPSNVVGGPSLALQ